MYGGRVQSITLYSCLTFNIINCLSGCFSLEKKIYCLNEKAAQRSQLFVRHQVSKEAVCYKLKCSYTI